MPLTEGRLIEQYRLLHRGKYGNTSLKLIARLLPHIRELAPASILDYGCGQSSLIDHLDYRQGVALYRYDPAIPDIATLPVEHVDLIINTDVLEHILESDIPDVLAHIASIADNAIFSIDMTESEQILPNGSNAHCTVKGQEWWERMLADYFKVIVPIRASRPSKCMFKTWPSNALNAPRRFSEFLWLTAQRKIFKKYLVA
uniref:Methyltransferase domain-containing protein n=1 Tax=Candidatus Kentrum sp. TUN TaxID=2126343 RepID=A0A451A8H4_9GAMM|nr:MAG: Methyltransferase domain-containing protein [Candidatus Kentron sp. TUN]VFK59371.1 MAG: Methyltransferase domain-containing protein [Candidatus Kentron sp. TUN]VFK62330.1 MAG: Methyltransferase domain-containing protein [Candidatus Kentron sp. TUN]